MTVLTVYAPGHYDPFDSYGLIACQLVRQLTGLGVHVNAVGRGQTVMDSQPADVRAVTSRPLLPSLGGIVLGYPTGYADHSQLLHCGPRVAVTMFESSKLPAGWVQPLNEMDAVIVPSHFCAESFRACGVTAPIHVVPLGVGEVYRYAERQPVLTASVGATGVSHSEGRPLTFLAFLDRGARKGGLVAVKAFARAFGQDTNYRLLLKARTRRNKDVTVTATEPNIEIIDRDMSEQELYELYLGCDVLINPHKGEGFGLLPREFAATGGISLTTNWSGTADDLNQWGWPLPYALEPATWPGVKRFAGQDLGEWASVDPTAVAQCLVEVAHHIPWYRAKAAINAPYVPVLYSWRAFAARVLDIWKEAAVGYYHRTTAA